MLFALALQAALLDHDDPAVRAEAEARYLRIDRALREAAAGGPPEALRDVLGAPLRARKPAADPFVRWSPGFELQDVALPDPRRTSRMPAAEAVARARAFLAALAELRGAGRTLEGRMRASALVARFEATLRDLLTK